MIPKDPYANYRELTLRGTLLGAILTVIFTASNVYLGLKVGLTFASSIPAAVISMTLLKSFSGSNILENNMVQTQASAAGTLASVIFVIPGMLMLGYWQDFPFWQTTLICLTGSLLGVIFTIPLRQVMVVQSDLPYPEGVAAAEILRTNEHHNNDVDKKVTQKDLGAKEIVIGSFVSGIFSFMSNGLRLISDSAGYWFKAGNAIFQIPMGFSLALLGAGYLVGIMGGIAILVGVLIAWLVAVPYFTAVAPMPLDTDIVAYAMNIWKTKVRFIGVGAIGISAIWTLITLLKPMISGLKQSFSSLNNHRTNQIDRANQDLSPKVMLLIVLTTTLTIGAVLAYFISTTPLSGGLTALLVVVCTILAVGIGFFIAAACGYMAGLVGSSSSPISGIIIIAVVIISLTLLGIGQSSGLLDTEDGKKFLTALTIYTASIVISVATLSNDNLQDLKTGYLVKATPWRQQVALLIGCAVGSVVIAPVLEMLYHAYGFTGAMPREGMDVAQALSAPQATLMTTIAQGIFSNNLEWSYIGVGVALGLCMIVIDISLKKTSQGRLAFPALAVGTGIYLPPSIDMPLVVGAVLAWFIARHIANKTKQLDTTQQAQLKEKVERRGTLFAAGLIVGESLMGVILAFIIAASVTAGSSDAPLAIKLDNWGTIADLLGLAAFIAGILILLKRVLNKTT